MLRILWTPRSQVAALTARPALFGANSDQPCRRKAPARRIRNIRRDRENFERDYPALLTALASSVRTGLDPLTALMRIHELFPERSVIAGELRAVREEIE